MGAVSTPLIETARSIFADLGYEVSSEGQELRAERKWRVVHVTTADPAEAPETGRLRCFVVRSDRVEVVRRKLLGMAPDYDWAVIGVEESGDYEVHHPTPETLPAP